MPNSFDPPSAIKIVGADVSKRAAQRAYDQAGVGPEDIDVIELHRLLLGQRGADLRGAPAWPGIEGEGTCWWINGTHHLRRTLGGQPSGGADLQGPSPGATGLAQCNELTLALRGTADARQVTGISTRCNTTLDSVAPASSPSTPNPPASQTH